LQKKTILLISSFSILFFSYGILVGHYNYFPFEIISDIKNTISPQSADEVYRFQYNKRNRPVVPGFNTEDLVPTPELTPSGRQFPGLDLIKDKYIRENPGSGVG